MTDPSMAEVDALAGEEVRLTNTTLENVVLDPDRLGTASIRQCESLVVGDCFDRVAMLLHHRVARPMHLLASREQRIEEQVRAIATITSRANCLAPLCATADGVWEVAAASLLSFRFQSGAASFDTVVSCDEAEHIAHVGLWIGAPPPCRIADEDASDGARAVAILMTAGSELPRDELTALVRHDSALVSAAALRVLADDLDVDRGAFEASLLPERPQVFFEAARGLALRASRAGLDVLRRQPALADALGHRALELYVLGGDLDEVGDVGKLLRGRRVTEADLDALGRFGNAETWAFLCHHLDSMEHVDVADSALRTLFGDLVGANEPPTRERWQAAIAQAETPTGMRVRRGRAWSPGVLADEMANGALSLRDVAKRLDEVRARTELRAPQRTLWLGEPACSQHIAAHVERLREGR